MKFKNARTAVAAVAFAALAVCLIAGVATGTWCGFGANDIAVLCPVGALLSMVAAKTLIPRAVLSIVVAIALVLLLGRLFCGWICPVTLWRRVKEFFKPVKTREQEAEALSQANQALAAEEIAALKEASATHDCAACGACHAKRNAPFDSRHAVLGGALLTTAVFGFPVFCLVCPVGLTFAAVALLVSLFGAGDLNWSLLFVPAMLVIELVFLRKWCGRFCPISAFMSLISRFSRTGMPVIDNERCLETAKGTACSRCATACTFDVNLRHPDLGELPLARLRPLRRLHRRLPHECHLLPRRQRQARSLRRCPLHGALRWQGENVCRTGFGRFGTRRSVRRWGRRLASSSRNL